jgi:hypothetical protein
MPKAEFIKNISQSKWNSLHTAYTIKITPAIRNDLFM